MNAIFLYDLADEMRRGLRGRIEAGASAGGLSSGYGVERVAPPQAVRRISMSAGDRPIVATRPTA